MSIFGLIVLIVIFCIIVWVARGYLPDPANKIVIIVAAALLILVLLQQFGFLGSLYTPLRVR